METTSSQTGSPSRGTPVRAVLWDLGGVMTTGPFEAFAAYECANGLPPGFLRAVNATDPHDNAWARVERGELTLAEFDAAFAAESEALGHRVPGAEVLARVRGTVRPEMVTALDHVVAAGYVTACLTNDIARESPPADADTADADTAVAAVRARFDHVVASSEVGCRKPEPRFYALACATAGVEATECVFLDDLGVNLAPARAMGMTTIKVSSSAQAIVELETVLGLRLR